MKIVSLSTILSIIIVVYIVHTVWNLAELFIPPVCNRGEKCITSYLASEPVQHLVLFTSLEERPDTYSYSIQKVYTAKTFDYLNPASFDITLKLAQQTRRNGSLFMHVVLLDENKLYKDFHDIMRSEAVYTVSLVTYAEPQIATFNLLKENKENVKSSKVRPYAHLSKKMPFSILTDKLNLPVKKIPGELYPYFRTRNGKFLPIIQHNVLKSRLADLELIDKSMTEFNMTVLVAPASYGSIRLVLHVKMALQQLTQLGFNFKDVDDVKGIFADTNLYLLCGTVTIASFHLLFDFLSFKNDVSFWRRKRSMAGLSGRTVLWRAFSQFMIFLYLLDEQTSMIVLIPAGISSIIELWKATKILHIRISFTGWRPSVWRELTTDKAEQSTAQADAEAMRYLSMLLYPLCIAGAVYSLVYEPHKSWYSWALHSIVNGVYAFGFLFMLPQLFVNYRLRSVAALPWRAFMYKAFNTFIDDVFAFIITMPTAHRVACFRDDLVFLVYLYQRWLYPVDETRTDTGGSMEESCEETEPAKDKTE